MPIPSHHNYLQFFFFRFNVSPSATLELLNRLSKVFKDYCGVLTEESIRKNFILIYELLDEMMDYGYPQITSTESLKICVHNEASAVSISGVIPTTISSSASSILFMNMKNLNINGSKTKPSGASNIPITLSGLANNVSSNYPMTKKKNEIFVDIIEKLTVLFNSNGYVVNSSIDGCIQMKSFLAGNPELRLALNEDLSIGRTNQSGGCVILDDCNFHDCVSLDEFEQNKIIHFYPPDGEFAVMNYRISLGDFRNPFKIFPSIEIIDNYRMEFICTILADIPEGSHGINIIVRIPLPKCTVSAKTEKQNTQTTSTDPTGSNAEYSSQDKRMIWNIRKFPGQSELTLRVKITLDSTVTAAHRKELGPISMTFEIPMYNISNLQVRYLRIAETDKSYNPHRWVRYITQSSSYVYRLQL